MATVAKKRDGASEEARESQSQTAEAPAEKLYETRPPFDLTEELQAKVNDLDLSDAVEHAKDSGYGIIYDPAPMEFNERLRETVLRINGGEKAGGASMLLAKDPVFEELVLNRSVEILQAVRVGSGIVEADVFISGQNIAEQMLTGG